LLQAYKYRPKDWIEPLSGPICMEIKFHMPRPKSHYRAGKRSYMLKDNSPVYHTKTPDLSNLIKFVEDALQGVNGFYKDDSQIVELRASKRYSQTHNPRTEIIIDEYYR